VLDPDYVWANAQNNPNFVDENWDGICDHRENGTTALGWRCFGRMRWANLSWTTLTTASSSTFTRRGFGRWAR